MNNGVDRYQFTHENGGEQFSLLAQKSTAAFDFTAVANPGSARMDGTWHTPAGTTGYDLSPGQTMQIPVR